MKKLPEDVKLSISRQIKGTWELDPLLDLLREEVENRERCAGVQASGTSGGQQSEPSPKKSSFTWKKSIPTTAATLFTGESTRSITCSYCRGEHTSANCHVVTDRAKRRQELRKQGRCFRCLKKDHVAKDCTSAKVCPKCSGRHHVSLCEESQARQSSEGKNSVPQTSSTAPPQTREAGTGNTATTNFHVSSYDSILLQTAQAIVQSPQSNANMRIRVIFDSGSQRSYITQHVKEQLNLNPGKRESLMIKTFGNTESAELRNCENVELIVKDLSQQFSTSVNLFVVPTICDPLGSQEIDKAKRNFAYLSDIELADSSDGESGIKIDVLIGADFYWKFFTGNIRQGEIGGPVASETRLGWVLSGPMPSSKSNLLSSVNLVSTHVLKIQSMVQPLVDYSEPGTECSMELVNKLWDLDAIGIVDTETIHESFLKNISFQEGRYVVRLPVKEKHKSLPDNYELALSRTWIH